MAPLLRNLRYSHACPAARLRARLPSAVARRSLRRMRRCPMHDAMSAPAGLGHTAALATGRNSYSVG